MSAPLNSSSPRRADDKERHHAVVGTLAALVVCLAALLAALGADLVSGAR
jgi:hypothetical protein